MSFHRRGAALLLASLITLGANGCNEPQNNGNRKNSGEAPKPAHWIAQYRAPASYKYSGANLAVFFYSGISVVSPDVVFVCGDTPNPSGVDERVAVILRTTDGGKNWIDAPVDIPKMHVPTLNSIHFISPTAGWAVGADSAEDGIVLKTTDGGSSWSPAKIGYKETPTSVFFVDADNGWIGGSTPPRGEEEEGGMGGPSALLATTDGGLTWQSRYNVPVSISRVCFADKMNGWAAGTGGKIYHTSDAGLTWDSQRTEIELPDGPYDPKSDGAKDFAIRGLQFVDKDHGFAAASSGKEAAGRLLVTTNGGASWHRQWMVAAAGVRDAFFVTPREGWALEDRGRFIYHTVDGGRSWLSEPSVFEQEVPIARLGAADAAHVWAVGGGAIFFRVSD